jgi:hypothetical protein
MRTFWPCVKDSVEKSVEKAAKGARMLPRYVIERLPIVSRMRLEVRLFAMIEGQPDQVCGEGGVRVD